MSLGFFNPADLAGNVFAEEGFLCCIHSAGSCTMITEELELLDPPHWVRVPRSWNLKKEKGRSFGF